jgi:hypothetical protein
MKHLAYALWQFGRIAAWYHLDPRCSIYPMHCGSVGLSLCSILSQNVANSIRIASVFSILNHDVTISLRTAALTTYGAAT